MAADFNDPGANTEATSIRDIGIAAFQDGFPGLVLRPGHPIFLLLDQTAEMVADCAQVFNNAQTYRFRTEGRFIDGIAPVEQTAATGSTEWVLSDPDPDGAAQRTVPASSQVSISDRMFLTVGDVTGAPGDTLTIPVVAKIAGSDGSGLTGQPQLLEAFGFVDSITLLDITVGGVDAETNDDYEPRLARDRQHRGRPTLPPDFEAKALDVPGVERVLVLDGYKPSDASSGNARTVTLVPVDDAGVAVSGGVQADVEAKIAGERETNWDVFVIDPTYTTVDVTTTVSIYDAYTAGDVQTRCLAALNAYLSPAAWGATPIGERPNWNDEPTVLRSELYAVLNNVEGVRHVTALTVGRQRTVTAAASTDVVTSAGHGLVDTDAITFTGLAGGSPLANGTDYFVRDSTTNTFKVAATSGGSAINITVDATAGTVHHLAAADLALLTPAALPLPGVMSVTIA